MAHGFHSIVHDLGLVARVVNDLTILDLERFALTCKKSRELVKKCRIKVAIVGKYSYHDYTGVRTVTVSPNNPRFLYTNVVFPPEVTEIIDFTRTYPLGTLPKNITSLCVNTIGKEDLPQLESLNANDVCLNNLELMPTLKKLTAHGLDLSPEMRFPHQLTELSFTLFSSPNCEVAKMIPRTVTDLDITFESADLIENWMMRDLPVGLKKLAMFSAHYTIKPHDSFHDNLIEIQLACPLINDGKITDLTKFPRNVEMLELVFIDPWSGNEPSTEEIVVELKKLPQTLKHCTLSVHKFNNEIIGALPKSITVLELMKRWDYQGKDFVLDPEVLPPNLFQLEFYCLEVQLPSSKIAALPRSLKLIENLNIIYDGTARGRRRTADFRGLVNLDRIAYCADKDISVFLPKSVRSLQSNHLPPELPPFLISLSTSDVVDCQRTAVPKTLKYLRAGSFCCATRQNFPPNLLTIFSDRDFHSLDPSVFPPTLVSYMTGSPKSKYKIKKIEMIDETTWVFAEKKS